MPRKGRAATSEHSGRKAAIVVAVVAAAAVSTFLFVGSSPARPPLADPACPAEAPVMAFNVRGALRQDDVAVTDGQGGIRRLTDDHASWDPSFSPDGSEIVFTSGRNGTHDECCGFDRVDVYVMRSDGTNQRPLMELSRGTMHYQGASTGEQPAWSPDGRWIAFLRGDGLFVVPPAGGEPTLIYEAEDAALHGPVWSRDSTQIAFRHWGRRENQSIFVVDVETKRARPFARNVGVDGDIAWSPDGESVAFERYPNVFVVSAGDPRRRLVAEGARAPAWSPDGSELAYLEDTSNGEDPQLFTQPVGSDERVRVDTGDADLYSFETDLDWLDCPGGG